MGQIPGPVDTPCSGPERHRQPGYIRLGDSRWDSEMLHTAAVPAAISLIYYSLIRPNYFTWIILLSSIGMPPWWSRGRSRGWRDNERTAEIWAITVAVQPMVVCVCFLLHTFKTHGVLHPVFARRPIRNGFSSFNVWKRKISTMKL